jgi:hypothetical protein
LRAAGSGLATPYQDALHLFWMLLEPLINLVLDQREHSMTEMKYKEPIANESDGISALCTVRLCDRAT